jgi:hypothetical protein
MGAPAALKRPFAVDELQHFRRFQLDQPTLEMRLRMQVGGERSNFFFVEVSAQSLGHHHDPLRPLVELRKQRTALGFISQMLGDDFQPAARLFAGKDLPLFFVGSVSSASVDDSIVLRPTSNHARFHDLWQSRLLPPSAQLPALARIAPLPNQNTSAGSNSAPGAEISRACYDWKLDHIAMLQPLAALLLIASPQAFDLAVTQLQHGCGIDQLQLLFSGSSHHFHSLQLTGAHSRPLQQNLPWLEVSV